MKSTGFTIIDFIQECGKTDPHESTNSVLARTLDLGGLVDQAERNVIKFFLALGNDFGRKYPMIILNEMSEEVEAYFKNEIKDGTCHWNALQFGYQIQEVYWLYYGFYDVWNTKGTLTYQGTYLHSFLHMTRPGAPNRICDPMIMSLRAKYGQGTVGDNYFGVHLPYSFVMKVYEKVGNYNYHTYLMTAFKDSGRTEALIAELMPYQKKYPEPCLLPAAK